MTNAIARSTIQTAKTASLATVADDGHPFVSLITVAATGPTTLVMLLSNLAKHTKYLLQDGHRHPTSSMYADFDDFAFFRVEITEAHLVAGFGRIETVSADQL